MKRVLAVTALLIGTAAVAAPLTASAADCAGVQITVHLDVNGTPQDVDQCIPVGAP